MPLLNDASAARLGTTQARALFLGDDRVWQRGDVGSDTFPGTTLDLQWTVRDIPGLGTVAVNDGLTLACPADAQGRYNPFGQVPLDAGLIIHQPHDNGDFEVRANWTVLGPGTTSHGFVFANDDWTSWVRSDMIRFSDRYRFNHTDGSAGVNLWQDDPIALGDVSAPLLLRIGKQGDDWYGQWSVDDGATWDPGFMGITRALDVRHIGLMLGAGSSTAPTTEVDRFEFERLTQLGATFVLLDRGGRSNAPPVGNFALASDSATNSALWLNRNAYPLDADGNDIRAEWEYIWDNQPIDVVVERDGYSTIYLTNVELPNLPMGTGSETDMTFDSVAWTHAAQDTRCTFKVGSLATLVVGPFQGGSNPTAGQYKKYSDRIACHPDSATEAEAVRTFWQTWDGYTFNIRNEEGTVLGTLTPSDYTMQAAAGVVYPGPLFNDTGHPAYAGSIGNSATAGVTTLTIDVVQ